MVDFPDPLQLLDSTEGQLVQGLDLGLHLRLANVDDLSGQAAEPVMAKSMAVLTMAFLASTLVMTPGGREGGGLDKIKKRQEKVIPTSLCSSSNSVHRSLAVRSCKEVVDYLQVLNSKKFWEASDGVEEEALFEVLGGAIREQAFFLSLSLFLMASFCCSDILAR